MGGGAFQQPQVSGLPRLRTPRMTPAQYKEMKQRYLAKLARYLGTIGNVTPLKEAPEKDSYGDIDMHIATDQQINWADMAASIGAAAWLDRGGVKSQKCSIAVYLNGRSHDSAPDQYMMSHTNNPNHGQISTHDGKEDYMQLDLEVVSPELEDWLIFYGSYGDMMAILGNIVTNFGFQISDKGILLRFQEFDDTRKPEWSHFNPPIEDGRMVMSTDMVAILNFLGLSVDKYRTGFETRESLYLWLSECRLINEQCGQRLWRNDNSRDRQKEKRTMYKEFFYEWLPEHLKTKKAMPSAEGNHDNTTASSIAAETTPDMTTSIIQRREQLLQESLDCFNKRTDYDTKHGALLRKRANETAMSQLRAMVIEHTGLTGGGLAKSVKAFRRHVWWDRDVYVPAILENGVSDAESLLYTFPASPDGLQLKYPDMISGWVKRNHEQVRYAAREK